ncbi:MAG: hypothetical protein H0V66_08250 [Bdellovibrionales bacterium]|nr:hypothetical protein [Bdellovibrionales bacterium]
MKLFMTMITAALVATACASPQEKYDDERMEAKEEYEKDLKQSEEEFKGDTAELNKDRAKDMIDNSDDANVDIEEDKIELE